MTIGSAAWQVWFSVVCWLAWTVAAAAEEPRELLLTRPPFDEIAVGKGAETSAIQVFPLDFPGRQLPDTRPAGSLEVRLIDRPGQTFQLAWNEIQGIRLYEQMLLDRANELVDQGEYDAAYDFFALLLRDYPEWPNLDSSITRYLQLNALAEYRRGNFDQALMLLGSLHDRSPDRSRLASAVERVAGKIIEQRIRADDYAGARAVLDLWQRQFPGIAETAVAQWRRRFQEAAAGHLSQARQLIRQERFSAGQKSIRRALAVWPELPGVAELYREIRRRYPQVIVGVFEMTPARPTQRLDCWPALRTHPLVSQSICALADYGSEGGIYQSRFGELEIDETGRELTLQMGRSDTHTPAGGSLVHGLARYILALAEPRAEAYDRTFAALCAGVSVGSTERLSIDLTRPHVRPEALLLTTLPESLAAGRFRLAQLDDSVARFVVRPGEQEVQLKAVVERAQFDEERAVDALLRGEIDVLDHVPPWRVKQLKSVAEMRVDSYGLPTVHVLVPGRDHDLLARREFRRALTYGINRPQILNQILAAGLEVPGFEVVSGPFPVGTSLSDPLRYAYHSQTIPRPYAPRLAATLALVAATGVEQARRQQHGGQAANSAADQGNADAAEDAGNSAPAHESDAQIGSDKPPLKPIVLAHSRDPLAVTACEAIRRQLVLLGIPIELVELSTQELYREPASYDLRYAELAVWEPVVDAHRLFGIDGLVGETTAAMRAALTSLERAVNWNEVSARLAEIHQLAHNDLPVIPLWQTVNHFAYRAELLGVDESPVRLYQNISAWRFPTGPNSP